MNKRTFTITTIPFLILILGIIGFPVTSATSQNLSITEYASSVSEADLVVIFDSDASTNINIDGVITAGEYPESFYSEYVDMNVSIAHNGSFLFVGMEADTNGYVAIGINEAGFGMVGADVKYGYVKDDGELVTGDSYNRMYAEPFPDKNSESDIVESFGINAGGVTTIEMVFPMVSSNETLDLTPFQPFSNAPYTVTADQRIEVNNTYALLYAWGTEDFMSLHHKKGVHSMFIAPSTQAPRSDTKVSFNLANNPNVATKDTSFTGTAVLTDSNDVPLANKEVFLYQEALIADVSIGEATTDNTGSVQYNFTLFQEFDSPIELYAVFKGDIEYKSQKSSQTIVNFDGEPAEEHEVFLVIGEELDFLVPYITGFGALAIVAGLWITFAYVGYTVLYLNARKPEEEETGGNEE